MSAGPDRPGHVTVYRQVDGEPATTLPGGAFGWGYAGTGAERLARAILRDRLDREPDATLVHTFKWEVIARQPRDDAFELAVAAIDDWLAAQGVA